MNAKELQYFLDDSVKSLMARTYDSVTEDEFTIVKTVGAARTRMLELYGPQVLVLRSRDAQLFYIAADTLTHENVPTKAGSNFTARLITLSGHDEDLQLQFRGVDET